MAVDKMANCLSSRLRRISLIGRDFILTILNLLIPFVPQSPGPTAIAMEARCSSDNPCQKLFRLSWTSERGRQQSQRGMDIQLSFHSGSKSVRACRTSGQKYLLDRIVRNVRGEKVENLLKLGYEVIHRFENIFRRFLGLILSTRAPRLMFFGSFKITSKKRIISRVMGISPQSQITSVGKRRISRC